MRAKRVIWWLPPIHLWSPSLHDQHQTGTVWTHHAVHRQELVPSLQATVPLGHAARNDAGDVDRRVLLLAAHHVEAQAFLRLGELHHARVRVALAGCEGGDCGLKEEKQSAVSLERKRCVNCENCVQLTSYTLTDYHSLNIRTNKGVGGPPLTPPLRRFFNHWLWHLIMN